MSPPYFNKPFGCGSDISLDYGWSLYCRVPRFQFLWLCSSQEILSNFATQMPSIHLAVFPGFSFILASGTVQFLIFNSSHGGFTIHWSRFLIVLCFEFLPIFPRSLVGISGLRQQHKAYSDKLAKSVAILQCYVAYIYSAPGPDLPAVAEP
jgi:hypothetical protein